jgi:putative radical SAM enzyme (TIGR03279 family)
MTMPRIHKVQPNSLAEELGLTSGDDLVRVNDVTIRDLVDLQFAMAAEEIELEVKKASGEIWIVEVDKLYDEDLGVEWEHPTLDRVKLCHNKCVFCFVDQIPSNMRQTLNVRDDDYRLSFLHGNFVTLTNVKQDDLDRIIQLKMSPLNISVHTTNPELRVRMLANRRSGEILQQISYLAEHQIVMNTQVVLCPEWNDGPELDRTIEDLATFYPHVQSLSVVPVGLTKHRRGLHKLRPCTSVEADRTIHQITRWQEKLRTELGVSFVHAADELYVMAKRDVPPKEYYDDFGQIENGVGVIRTFLEEISQAKQSCVRLSPVPNRSVGIVTGVSAQQVIQDITTDITKEHSVQCTVFPVTNNFYGTNVTVTGLLTATDIIDHLRGHVDGLDTILLPDIMLKDDDDVFLDDLRVSDVEEALQTRVTVVPATGLGLFMGILGHTQHLPPRRRYETTLQDGISASRSVS